MLDYVDTFRDYKIGDVVEETYTYTTDKLNPSGTVIRWVLKIDEVIDDNFNSFGVTIINRRFITLDEDDDETRYLKVGQDCTWTFDTDKDKLCGGNCHKCKVRFICLTT